MDIDAALEKYFTQPLPKGTNVDEEMISLRWISPFRFLDPALPKTKFLCGSKHPTDWEAFVKANDKHEWNINHIINLVMHVDPNCTRTLQKTSIILHHIPVKDFYPPTMDQFQQACVIIDDAFINNQVVLVHCHAGCGRTGSILAAAVAYLNLKYASAQNFSKITHPILKSCSEQFLSLQDSTMDITGPKCVKFVRKQRKCYVESKRQEERIQEFVNMLKCDQNDLDEIQTGEIELSDIV